MGKELQISKNHSIRGTNTARPYMDICARGRCACHTRRAYAVRANPLPEKKEGASRSRTPSNPERSTTSALHVKLPYASTVLRGSSYIQLTCPPALRL